MEEKILNVAIVGGGPGCKAIMDMIFTEKLSQLRMKLIGVACTNPEAVGYRYSREKGIYTTGDYRDLYKFKDLNLIIELTGRDEVANEISRTRPEHVRLMDHVGARLFWDVFKIEEKRVVEREHAAEAIRESESKSRLILQTMPSGLFTVGLNRKITSWNKGAEDITGLKAEQVIGKDCLEALDCDAYKEGCALFDDKVDKPIYGKECTLYVDGRKITISKNADTLNDWEGNTISGLESFVDITERKRAEEALVQAKEDWENTFDAISDMVMLLDNDHRIIRVNRTTAKALNVTKESLVGKTCYGAMHSQRHPIRQCPLALTVKTLKPQTKEITEPKLGGTFLCSTSPLLDRDGKLVGYTLSLKDITESKHLEAQLHQAQKLEAIGTLAGGMAHDFNNLLMGVQGNVSLMLMDIDSTHPYYERLKKIEKQVQSGARLTTHLLGYARKGRYEVKSVDLNQLVEEICETFGRTRKEITIRRELAEDLFPIEADPGQTEQVLLNLYVNAADAMPDGGNLILKTMNTTHDHMKGKLYDPKPGKYVLLTVTDTGVGMDKETMERVFDPFFTTKEMGRGTGLGLASAYGIIKSHGGYIDVDSKKGQGTAFSVYLPVSEKKLGKAVEATEQFIKGTGTVLLVDDEEVILEVGQELLEALGYRVLTAKDGKETIEVYRKNQHDIDFVLLDMIMPDIGGGETYDKMKEINPDVKALLSSGYSIDGQATEILERGCDGFIQKPFTMEELSQSIKEVLGKE